MRWVYLITLAILYPILVINLNKPLTTNINAIKLARHFVLYNMFK